MKILIVSLHSSRIGKANLDVFNPAIELSKRGHDIYVISRADLDPAPSRIPVDLGSVKVYPLAFSHPLYSFVFLPFFAIRVFHVANKVKPDIIVAENNLHCPFVGYIVAKVCRLPLLVLLRELTADALYYDKSKHLLKRGLAWLMMKAGHFLLSQVEHKVAINSGIAKYYTKVLEQEIPSIWLLGFDLSRFDYDEAILRQTENKYDLRKEKSKILYTGTLVLERGILPIFQVLSQLPEPDVFQLIITGEGKAQDILREEAHRLGVLKHVSFLGWLTTEDLNALLCLADVGLEPYARPWPQDYTPSSKVALYVAAGLFVIATEAPGYQEVVMDGENGYLYEDIEELSTFFQILVDDPDYLAEQKNRARAYRKIVDIVPSVDRLEYLLSEIVMS